MASYSDRDKFRARLKALMQSAHDEAFVQLLWAVNVLQSEAGKLPVGLLRGWKEADATHDIMARNAVHKWEIEDLTNELFTTSKTHSRGFWNREAYSSFQTVLGVARVIRSLHNAEDGIALSDANIQMEMKRVVARQFDWQRGFLNMPQFYRSTFIYGQGPSADFFEKSCGLSISDFSLIGVGLYGFLMSNLSSPHRVVRVVC